MPPSTPVDIAAWLGCLAFVIALVNQGFRLFDRFRDSAKPVPDPAATYLPRSEFTLQQQSLSERLIRVEQQIEDARHQRESDHAKIYTKLDELRGSVAGLTASSQSTQTQVAQLVDRVDRLVTKLGT